MKEPFLIPRERLPPGFAETVDHIPDVPVVPRPAATAVLMRDAAHAPEILLLKRNREVGFVPGAFVFPGGRVDAADGGMPWPGEPSDPPAEYWTAAVREVFEETGILLARAADRSLAPDATDPELAEWRERLLREEATLEDVLKARRLRPDAEAITCIGHWITPVVEPRRYDTRFFLARLPEQRAVQVDGREHVEAVWLSARSALQKFEAGALPMVFPTVKTLQMLEPFGTVAAAFQAFRAAPVKPILPRLVRMSGGVGIVIDGEMSGSKDGDAGHSSGAGHG